MRTPAVSPTQQPLEQDGASLATVAKRLLRASDDYVDTINFIRKCPRPVGDQLDQTFAEMLADSLIFLEEAKASLIAARRASEARDD